MSGALSTDLASFEAAVRAGRAADFDWRAAYADLARAMPAADVPAMQLFAALSADIERSVEAGMVHAYHNHLHTLDAMHAMQLLCTAAARIGVELAAPAHILLLVMLGHDLRHPGGSSSPTRDIELASAEIVAAMARDSLMPASQIERIVDLILSTRPAFQIGMRAKGAGDLLHYLVGEADVLASLLPGFGLSFAADLTREMAEAGAPVAIPFEAPQARRAFLKAYEGISDPARALGLDVAMAAQIAALV